MKYTALFAALVASGALVACEVDKVDDGEMPNVDVDVSADAGELPEYDVETADVELRTEEKKIEVPDVDVDVDTETTEVTVPDIDIEMPDEDEQTPSSR